ncbi:hypothetical protein VTJ04DRAFT_3316 [Mycothermus thermophilus]|uniref:uncharacterized protein n=1 Tax=Humicola insolens TaxID=85995 RepID=UPI003742CFA6
MADNLPTEHEMRAGRSDSTASDMSVHSRRESTGSMTMPAAMRAAQASLPQPSQRGLQPGQPQANQPTQRRSSSGSGRHLFESLEAQKRKDDPASVARRQSMSEQRPPPGFIGRLWNKYVRDLP